MVALAGSDDLAKIAVGSGAGGANTARVVDGLCTRLSADVKRQVTKVALLAGRTGAAVKMWACLDSALAPAKRLKRRSSRRPNNRFPLEPTAWVVELAPDANE